MIERCIGKDERTRAPITSVSNQGGGGSKADLMNIFNVRGRGRGFNIEVSGRGSKVMADINVRRRNEGGAPLSIKGRGRGRGYDQNMNMKHVFPGGRNERGIGSKILSGSSSTVSPKPVSRVNKSSRDNSRSKVVVKARENKNVVSTHALSADISSPKDIVLANYDPRYGPLLEKVQNHLTYNSMVGSVPHGCYYGHPVNIKGDRAILVVGKTYHDF